MLFMGGGGSVFVWPAGLVFRNLLENSPLFSVSNFSNNKFWKNQQLLIKEQITPHTGTCPHWALCDKLFIKLNCVISIQRGENVPMNHLSAREQTVWKSFTSLLPEHQRFTETNIDRIWALTVTVKHMNDNAENWEKVVSGQAERSLRQKTSEVAVCLNYIFNTFLYYHNLICLTNPSQCIHVFSY